jgi:hypothetical protein
MSAESLALSVDDIAIIFQNAKVGSVPSTALCLFRYWQALQTSGGGDNCCAAAIVAMDMTSCIESISANGLPDVQLWIRHLQQPSKKLNDAEKLRLQPMYDYLMYQDCNGSNELYPRSLWISAIFDGTDALPVGVNDVAVKDGVDGFITFLLGNPQVARRLMRFQCRHAVISAEQLVVLLSNLPRLVDLQLYVNRIGDAGAAALAQSQTLRNLTSLNLGWNRIGYAGTASLAQSPNLQNLTSLDLSCNEIGPEGAAALAQSPNLRNLTSLNLGWNRIGDSGAVALAQSQTMPNLTTLDLEMNQIGPGAATALAQSQTLLNLTSLNLSWNQIGDAGASALAESPNLLNLTSLDLSVNQISHRGAAALAKSANLQNLTSLKC